MKKLLCFIFSLLSLSWLMANPVYAKIIISKATKRCLSCHQYVSPGIVAEWEKSIHAHKSPSMALKQPRLTRCISTKYIPSRFKNVVVGCAECHTINPKNHKDTFNHNGFKVHIIVTPKDCAVCHPVEVKQYDKNIMSHAYANLMKNPVYHNLLETTNGVQELSHGKLIYKKADSKTNADSCLCCHGTKVEVKGFKVVKTKMGEMKVPVLSGWPNEGVGRINPDGSIGSCASCHPRHSFSIAVARKPYTCAQCHKGPDVPAYKVYMVSKHGNIYYSQGSKWNFKAIPWVVGKDFSSPTCATCHVSLIVDKHGHVIAKRTHQMNDRSPWRLFGLIYACPHPKSPDTTLIKNKMGLPLPTELTGEPVTKYLISQKEMKRRLKRMEDVCLACHSQSWVNGHFERLTHTIETTNAMTLAATKILLTAWQKGAAKGLAQKDSIFNEAIEKMWVEQWLFYANSTRFASAMAGADYGAFANGRWYMSKNLQQMLDWLDFKLKLSKESTKKK